MKSIARIQKNGTAYVEMTSMHGWMNLLSYQEVLIEITDTTLIVCQRQFKCLARHMALEWREHLP